MKLSILIAVYNEESFIEHCLDSIFQCEGLSYEVIVVDDFSTDNTLAKLRQYALRNAHINLLIQSNNQKGKNNAFNMAYQLSSGDAFCFVGGDDLVVSCDFKKRLALIENVPGPVVSLCKLKTFSENPKLDGLVYPKKFGVGAMAGGAMIFNGDFAKIIFPLPSSLPNEDTWLRLAIKYFDVQVRHYPFVSYLYRQHSGNSVRLTSSFSEFSSAIASRNAALIFFKTRFLNVLDRRAVEELDAEVQLELYRRSGRGWAILLMRGVSFRDKISALLICNSFLYFFRVLFYRFFAGR